MDPQPEPRCSIVTAVYDVARYLPAFIASIEAQSVGTDRLEVIAVDDGSTDESLAVLRAWERRRPDLVTVLTKTNGGQASARNLGLDAARGTWVTFTDPDDTLAPDYLAQVEAFVDAHPETAMVATKFIYDEEATGRHRDGHPLRWRFADGDRLVDLDRSPTYFHGSAPAAFFRLDRIREQGLRFDERLRSHFEDGHFCVRYLLAADQPLVGFVGSAIYYYRRRADLTSTLQGSLRHPGRYTVVPELGYLDCLERSLATHGRVAEWVQNLIIYELSWYFSSEDAVSGAATAVVGEVADAFRPVLARIAARLDPAVVDSFTIRRFDRKWRDILLHGFTGEPWHTPYAVLTRRDPRHREIQVAFRHLGPAPSVDYLVDGRPVVPAHGKRQAHVYFDAELLSEQLAWLPEGTLRVLLDGRPVDLVDRWQEPHRTSRTETQIEELFRPDPVTPRLSPQARGFRWLARTVGRALFDDAWVIMDRIHDADDSGERLFRYLREHEPQVNAWFVVERGTPDWKRLRADGFGRRLVSYGSNPWRALMISCRHLISSHIDQPIYRPPKIGHLRRPDWTFTFLQHGVIKDDLSRWLNTKKIDLFVSSTPAEHASLVGDGTRYRVTSKEVVQTGLPRFDRLREVGAAHADQRDLILLAPTWRHWLTAQHAVGSQRRAVIDQFADSEFFRQWDRLLRSPELAALAQRHDKTIAFLPHPNLQSAMSDIALPPGVQHLQFHGQDVQTYFARAAVLVTDYSSMAFNAAYLDRPVVYFQFDAERMQTGGHVGRAGYFDYRRDGFGPVTATASDAVASVAQILQAGSTMLPAYAERTAATFPQRDGRCCARVTAAIKALEGPAQVRS